MSVIPVARLTSNDLAHLGRNLLAQVRRERPRGRAGSLRAAAAGQMKQAAPGAVEDSRGCNLALPCHAAPGLATPRQTTPRPARSRNGREPVWASQGPNPNDRLT